MFKYVLLGSAMIVATPAIAQDMAMPQSAAPSTTTATPQTMTPATPSTATTPADPATTTAQTPSTAPAADPMAAQPAQTAEAAQPAGGSQVSSIVDTEFASYDKDSNGSLSKTEFASWMNALKAKAPAGTETASKPDPKWNDAAFKQADGDKSKSVSKEELASFLSGAANAS